MNVAVLIGVVRGEVRSRTLSDGRRVGEFDVSTPLADDPVLVTVPVVWREPPARFDKIASADHVVVTGSVQRRFFRSGGATIARTEVVADDVVPTTQRAKTARAIERAVSGLGD